MFFYTVTAKTAKTIPWDSQAQRKDHNSGTKQFVLEEILLSFGYDAPYHPWCN